MIPEGIGRLMFTFAKRQGSKTARQLTAAAAAYAPV